MKLNKFSQENQKKIEKIKKMSEDEKYVIKTLAKALQKIKKLDLDFEPKN